MTSSNYAEKRLAGSGVPRRAYRSLPDEAAHALVNEIVTLFKQGSLTRLSRADATDWSYAKIRTYLSQLALPEEREITFLWVAPRAGMTARYGTVVRHFDALWSPSSDDIWIVSCVDHLLLEVDHEERITVNRR